MQIIHKIRIHQKYVDNRFLRKGKNLEEMKTSIFVNIVVTLLAQQETTKNTKIAQWTQRCQEARYHMDKILNY